MNTRQMFAVFSVILLGTVAACINEEQNPLSSPNSISPNSVSVEMGFTQGSEGSWTYENLGEYSAFTLHWREVADAS